VTRGCRGKLGRMGWRLVTLACAVWIAACASQSTDEEAPGAAGKAVAGSGGSGARAGFGAAGGSLSFGGSLSLGGSFSEAGASTGGEPGEAPECQLPLVSGNCRAAIPRYGFVPTLGHCKQFVYGGCDANANNFESLKECEKACGGSAVGDCPAGLPEVAGRCSGATTTCHYAPNGCLCALESRAGYCFPIDSSCQSPQGKTASSDVPGCTGPDCPSLLVAPIPYTCECSKGAWSCAH
jgi:hypothetical protein